ncbi:hypothetical protein AVEN_182027-1, partial [Araneus ventricosus]
MSDFIFITKAVGKLSTVNSNSLRPGQMVVPRFTIPTSVTTTILEVSQATTPVTTTSPKISQPDTAVSTMVLEVSQGTTQATTTIGEVSTVTP